MARPKDNAEQVVPDDVGMEDILRSIQGILGEAPEAAVRFPAPEASANDSRPVARENGEREPPLAFLRRKRTAEATEHVSAGSLAPEPDTPQPAAPDTVPNGAIMPSLDERLARHRAKAEAERAALRALANRATAKAAPEPTSVPEPKSAPAPEPQTGKLANAELLLERQPNEEPPVIEAVVPEASEAPAAALDIFAEGEDLLEPPATAKRPRRMALPEIEAETVDYSARAPLERVEVMARVSEPRERLDETFEDLARSMLHERGADLDLILSDMMRPLVREWLDDNLSGIVERVVREEIERVSRGGR